MVQQLLQQVERHVQPQLQVYLTGIIEGTVDSNLKDDFTTLVYQVAASCANAEACLRAGKTPLLAGKILMSVEAKLLQSESASCLHQTSRDEGNLHMPSFEA